MSNTNRSSSAQQLSSESPTDDGANNSSARRCKRLSNKPPTDGGNSSSDNSSPPHVDLANIWWMDDMTKYVSLSESPTDDASGSSGLSSPAQDQYQLNGNGTPTVSAYL